jgi:hypothetical protein
MWYQRSSAPTAAAGFGSLNYSAVYFYDSTPGRYNAAAGATAYAFADWSANLGYEAGALMADPLLDDTLAPVAGSPVLGAGTAAGVQDGLTAAPVLAQAGNFVLFGPVSEDARGIARPNASALDIGAVQASEGGSPSAAVDSLPPANAISPVDSAVGTCGVAPSTVDPNVLWVPGWHKAAPTAFTEDSVYASCLNSGAMFAGSSEWSRPVQGLPKHALSDAWIINVGPSKSIWPAFGSVYDGAPNAFLFGYVAGSVPKRGVSFVFPGESDYAYLPDVVSPSFPATWGYPLLPQVPIEGGNCDNVGDRHALLLDREHCVLYELFKVSVKDAPEAAAAADQYQFSAESGAVWAMASNGDPLAGGRVRGVQMGATSADAAGMPIFPGLATYYEVVTKGVIKHALRFTVQRSSMAFLYPPATHYASSEPDTAVMPMGARLRLSATYNCTATMATKEARVICVALQTYGMFLADNGGDGAISGVSDPRFNDAALAELRKIKLSHFEAVETGAVLCLDAGCTNAPSATGAAGAHC